ncbi:MAG TPA: orotidine-5'-phosphate decarboxylase [Galbitalea sp.]
MSAATPGFGGRLEEVFAASGHLCVGIDPHPYLLGEWRLPATAAGARDFGLRVVAAAEGVIGILKPQVAFFERYGSAGFVALEEIFAAARAAGLLVIADAKRGDIGSTAAAYGEAWLSPGSPLEADAMTINAFQGVGSLEEPMRLAAANGKGLFVLAATSNPESVASQTATLDRGPLAGRTVAASIVDEVKSNNANHTGGDGLGPFGVVIGATVRLADYGISPGELKGTPILAPGFGHQGAGYDAIDAVYGTAAAGTVVSSSRAILAAGPNDVRTAIQAEADVLSRVFAA